MKVWKFNAKPETWIFLQVLSEFRTKENSGKQASYLVGNLSTAAYLIHRIYLRKRAQ